MDIGTYDVLQSMITKMINKRSTSMHVIAIYKDSDEWKMIPVDQPEPSAQMSSSSHQYLGIPTFEGFEFVTSDEIIRCEGLQKCTRIVLKNKDNIVSSFNIGEFEKMLSNYGFFSTHKSHLINLSCICRYSKDGTLIMCDNSVVPVSRRRKKIFLEQFPHI